MKELKVEVANRSKVITPSGFRNYDVCANPYVGCQIGCAYCYVRFFVKDEEKDWGEFVRVREHIKDKLPKELEKGYVTVPDGKKASKSIKIEDLRMVIGTMTDPYQPIERKYRITRAMLEALINSKAQLNKVGIFTRSPIVTEDIDLIVKLPRKRVHYTVTPCPPDIMKLIEPIAIRVDRRFEVIKELKKEGIRCHVNIAPAIPTLSEQYIDEYAETLADIGVDEFFVDPMQAYGESWEAMKKALQGNEHWTGIEEVMGDKENYTAWKELFKARWFEAWSKVRYKSPHTLPIWGDHVHHTWVNMNDGSQMSLDRYGDDV